MAEADLDSSCLLNKKIRNAQLAQYNFILGRDHSTLITNHYSLYVQAVIFSVCRSIRRGLTVVHRDIEMTNCKAVIIMTV